jgi:hypothetical protein
MSSGYSTPPRQPILPVNDPAESWDRISPHQIFATPPTSASDIDKDEVEWPAGFIRIVCISDTHGFHRSVHIRPCDVLIHSGDFTNCGEPDL